MHTNEVLEILHPSVVLRASGVHALDDGCDVAKDHCVHQGCRQQMQSSVMAFVSVFFFFFFDDFDFFFLMRWDVLKLTAHQHHADGEDFFCVRIGTHVAKPDAGEAAEGEVEGGDVGAGYRGATHGAVDVRRLQTLSQLLKPSCRVRSNGSCVRVMLAYKVTAKCSLLWVFFAIVWVSSDNRPFPFGWWYDGNITGNYIIHCWWYNGNCLWVILGDDANAWRHPWPIGVLWDAQKKHLTKCNESGRTLHTSFPGISAFTLTDVPGNRVAAFYLRTSDDIPDAGHPVSQESKRGHEQRQNHSAVLGVTIQFLQQAQQTKQTNCF